MNVPPDRDHDPACPFCRNLSGANPRCAFVSQSDGVSSFVNPRQYRPGATLVIPDRHVATIFDMTPDEWSAVTVHAQRIAVAACSAFGAPGVNIFQNNGSSAGQTVSHVHVHVVPRPEGDEGSAIFGEAHFDTTPVAERLAVAARIREHLAAAP
ncbi:MAG: HIT family protein [Gammaproteobacteria bacterium]|nr:HIT family protein [Gammaproteobacteria bacterium]